MQFRGADACVQELEFLQGGGVWRWFHTFCVPSFFYRAYRAVCDTNLFKSWVPEQGLWDSGETKLRFG